MSENEEIPPIDEGVTDGVSAGSSTSCCTEFDAIVAGYFEAKSREALQESVTQASENVAVLVMTKPAQLPRQVMVKVMVFEAELTSECDDGPWPDHRILPMFAGLKADLIRFGIGCSCESAGGHS